MSQYIVETVQEYVEKIVRSMGLELFDLQYRREGHGWVLRVMIDSENGITLDDCSKVSRELSQYLDVEDIIEHAYHLEVSSPGAERPLRSTEEYKRFVGSKTKIKLHEAIEGQKSFIGTIEAVSEDILTLSVNDKQLALEIVNINTARLAI